MVDRRTVIAGAGVAAVAVGGRTAFAATGSKSGPAGPRDLGPFAPSRGARVRVMMVNDLGGDPDGLFAAVHALLSPSARVVGIVGTAAAEPDETAGRSVELADEVLQLMGLTGNVRVHLGAERRLVDTQTPVDWAGARAIVAEAMSTSELPLCVTVGGGLTESPARYCWNHGLPSA